MIQVMRNLSGLLLYSGILLLALSGCAQLPNQGNASGSDLVDVEIEGELGSDAVGGQRRGDDSKPVLPAQELTETILYEFLLAEIAGQRGNIGLSAQAYFDLAKRTRDPRIARRATEVSIFARMNNIALDAARIWYETDPRSANAAQALAGLLLGAGQFEEAYPHIRKMLAVPGGNAADAFFQINRSLQNVQDKAAALQFMQRLAGDFASLPQAHIAVAQAALGAAREDLALEAVRKAQNLRPDWEPGVLFEAQILQRKSNPEAIKRLAQHLERYPNARDIRMNYARALATEKRVAEARAEFQKLLSDFPTNTDVIYSVAILALQSNDLPVAEANFRRLLELDYRDKDGVRLTLGQIAEEQNQLPDALRWYAEIDSGNQYLQAQIRYAQVLAKQGDLSKARGHLQKIAEESKEQQVPLLLAEAQILRQANQIKEAFQFLGKALEGQPDNPDLLYDYGMLAERVDRIDLLESSMRKVIAARPDYAHAYNALGYSFADRNIRLAEARELIERALKLAPRDFAIIDSMGWVLYRMGEHAAAIKYLREAFSGQPDAEVSAHLGEVLWVSGERAEAEKIWREASQKYPKDEILSNTLKRFLPR
ncbi:MAG: tetratricopeptide repeat protein [Burkholderiales bacterium]